MIMGCGSEAVRFNNAISSTTKDLEKIGFDLGKEIGLSRGNPGKLKDLYAKAVKDAMRVIDDGKALKAPKDENAKEFREVFLEYLSAEDRIIRHDLGRIVDMLKYNNLSGVQAALQDVQQYENKYVQKLKTAQAKYAKAHGITLLK